jgi:hypothetical protein
MLRATRFSTSTRTAFTSQARLARRGRRFPRTRRGPLTTAMRLQSWRFVLRMQRVDVLGPSSVGHTSSPVRARAAARNATDANDRSADALPWVPCHLRPTTCDDCPRCKPTTQYARRRGSSGESAAPLHRDSDCPNHSLCVCGEGAARSGITRQRIWASRHLISAFRHRTSRCHRNFAMPGMIQVGQHRQQIQRRMATSPPPIPESDCCDRADQAIPNLHSGQPMGSVDAHD